MKSFGDLKWFVIQASTFHQRLVSFYTFLYSVLILTKAYNSKQSD